MTWITRNDKLVQLRRLLENEYDIQPLTPSRRKLRAQDNQLENLNSTSVSELVDDDTWDTLLSRKGYGDHDRNVTFEYDTPIFMILHPTKYIIVLLRHITGSIWINRR